MSRSVTGKLFPAFKNYTDEMYFGNAPAGIGHKMLSGGYSDRWETKYGSGETYNGKILHFSLKIGYKISVFICGDSLYILDIRYSGKSDIWEYSNDGKCIMPGGICLSDSHRHDLETEAIEKILNTKVDNCKVWDMAMKRARELYEHK